MKKNKLTGGFFFLALFLIFLLPPTDPDLGWHLRCGQEIWQKNSFCTQNQFSVLLANYFWTNHYWFYQAIISSIYQAFGLWGLTFLNAFLMSFAFLFFYYAVTNSVYFAGKNYFLEKILAIGLTVLFGWGVFMFGIRSQLTGFFFFALLLWFLTKIEEKPKLGFFLPLIFLIWANTHASVTLGLLLVSLFGIKKMIQKQKQSFLFSLILLLCLLATLLNPFGFKIYQEAWQHFAVVGLEKLIAEWVPPAGLSWWLILIAGFSLFIFILLRKAAKNKILALWLLPFIFLGLKARRNVPFFWIMFFYLFFQSLTIKTVLKNWLKKEEVRQIFSLLLIFSLIFFGLSIRLPTTVKINKSWLLFCQSAPVSYPCQAIEYLKNQETKGNIFNTYEWGGFLIWQLPQFKVFVDGRMPAWSTPSNKSPYTIYLETLQTQPGWQKTLDDYNIDWILISPGTFMDLKLKLNPEKFGWQEVYRDKNSVIYKKI